MHKDTLKVKDRRLEYIKDIIIDIEWKRYQNFKKLSHYTEAWRALAN